MDKPLTLLMTTDTVGGVWTYTMELCRALLKYNTHLHLVTLGAYMQPWQKQEVSTLKGVIVYETDIPLEWMDDPWQRIESSYKYLLSLEDTIKPDIIHLNNYAYGKLPWHAPVLTVAHSDVFTWYTSVKNERPPASWNRYYSEVQQSLNSSDRVVAPSRAYLHDLATCYRFTANTGVIYNSRSSSFFGAGIKDNSVMSMGRIWDEAKNINLLASAAPLINGSIKIAGDNHFEQQSLYIERSNVQYLGKLNTQMLARELATASIYVLPAKYEPFGLSVLEAALSGCALVLGDVQSLRELWGDSALYVNTDNEVMLAHTINSLLSNNDLMRKYAERAYQRAQLYAGADIGAAYMTGYGIMQENKLFVT